MSNLRVAVIGAGHLGRIHAKLIHAIEGMDLVAVVDPSQPARQQVEQQLGVQTLADYHYLTGHVDAVVVAAPTNLHHTIANWSLKHGLHTFVEKPLVKSTVEAESLIALARDRSCVLQVGHVERFSPAWTTARQHIVDAKYITAVRAGTFTGRSTDIGVVFDLMIHDLDLILQSVPSPIVHVDAMGIALLGHHEDIAEARLRFANGCVATIRASRVSQQAVREMQIYTSRSFVRVDFGASQVELIEPSPEVLSRRFQADLLPMTQRLALKDELFTKWLPMQKLEVQPVNAIEQELLDFASAIRNGVEPQVTAQHARDAIEVAESILASIQMHPWGDVTKGAVATGPLATPVPGIIPAAHRFQGPHREETSEPRRRHAA